MSFYQHWRNVPATAWRWPDFSPAEIACGSTGKLLFNEQALDRLQELRRTLDQPMMVNSAYRSPEHNARVGGAKMSQHLSGAAFDISMANHDPEDFIAARARPASPESAPIRGRTSSTSISVRPGSGANLFRNGLRASRPTSNQPVKNWRRAAQ